MIKVHIRAIGLLFLLSAFSATAQVRQPSSEALANSAAAFQLVPGVVVDPTTDALFLMNPEGGVDKISVSSGNVLWSSADAAKPLSLYGDQLVAQAERADQTGLLIVFLDTFDGASLQEFTLPLPSGVGAGIDSGMGHSSFVSTVIKDGAPFLSLNASSHYMGGAAPGPNQALETKQRAAYRLDLASSSFVQVEDEASQAVVWSPTVQSWLSSHPASQRPTRAGNLYATTEVTEDQSSPLARIVLKRWDQSTGAALGDLELFRGPYILHFRSADGRHLMVSARVAPGEFDEYEWSIFSLETGARVGQYRHHQSHAHFFASDRSLVFVSRPYGHRTSANGWVDEPLKVSAVVWNSGATVWDEPLRDTSYSGPVPP